MISPTWLTQARQITRLQELSATPVDCRPALDSRDRQNRLTCLAARLLLRSSLWLSAVGFRHTGRNVLDATIRAIAAIVVRALVGCARGFGTTLWVLRLAMS